LDMAQIELTGVLKSSSFEGVSSGQVKQLSGFRKGIHRVPDLANDTTNRFLAKICETELAEEGESLYQRLKVGLGYKRRDLNLSVDSPSVLLSGKEFVFEIAYTLDSEVPSTYQVITTLSGLNHVSILKSDVFNEICQGLFSRLSYGFTDAVQIEKVIDMIEECPKPGIRVEYPSDCRECSVFLEGFSGQIQCRQFSLDIMLPTKSSPKTFLGGFEALRGAGMPFEELFTALE
jgi:hypothetical protein